MTAEDAVSDEKRAAFTRVRETVGVSATAGQARVLAELPGDGFLAEGEAEPLAAVDLRLLGERMEGPGKIGAAADRITEIFRRHPAALQVVFCDAWAGEWSAHAELARQLAARGVSAVAARTRDDTGPGPGFASLLRSCLTEQASVLVTGTPPAASPLPGRVTAVHHLDPPQSPARLLGRESFISETGRGASMVQVIRYVTEGTSDRAWWESVTTGRARQRR